MLAYQIDEDGYYVGIVIRQKDPINSTPEVPAYLMPLGAIVVVPPDEVVDRIRHWTGTIWEQIEDYRGQEIFSTSDASANPEDVVDIGPIKSGWSLTKSVERVTYETALTFKNSRAELLHNAEVTVNSKVYQADEISQGRMLSAIQAANTLGATTIPFWMLKDNTKYEDIPIAEFKDVHAAAVVYMAGIWTPAV